MNATTVIAYTFDADYHCIGCTERYSPGVTDWRAEGFDPDAFTDSEGNRIHPVFASDEWWNVSDDRCEVLACGTCHAPIDAAHRDSCVHQYGDEPCSFTDEQLP